MPDNFIASLPLITEHFHFVIFAVSLVLWGIAAWRIFSYHKPLWLKLCGVAVFSTIVPASFAPAPIYFFIPLVMLVMHLTFFPLADTKSRVPADPMDTATKFSVIPRVGAARNHFKATPTRNR